MDTYDKWKQNTPDNDLKVFCKCETCHQDIYEGEEFIDTLNCYIHSECFEEFAKEILNPITRIAGEQF